MCSELLQSWGLVNPTSSPQTGAFLSFVAPFGEQLAKAKVLHPGELRNAFKLIAF